MYLFFQVTIMRNNMRFLFIQGYNYSFPLSSQKVKSVLANSIRKRPSEVLAIVIKESQAVPLAESKRASKQS